MLSHRAIKKEKKKISEYSEGASKLLKSFVELHIERDEFLTEISMFSEGDWQKYQQGSHKLYEKMKKNVSRDSAILRVLERDLDKVGTNLKDINKSFSNGATPKNLMKELNYVSFMIDGVETCLEFYKDKVADHTRHRNNPIQLLLSITSYHEEEKTHLHSLLDDFAPERLEKFRRLMFNIKNFIESPDAKKRIGVWTGLGGAIGLVIAIYNVLNTGVTERSTNYQEIPFKERVAGGLVILAFVVVSTFLSGVYDSLKKFNEYEQSKNIDHVAYLVKQKLQEKMH